MKYIKLFESGKWNNDVDKTTLKLIVDIENNNVRTEGATHPLKGNVDGNINFFEAGIGGMTDKEVIEEVLIELNEGEYDEVIVTFI